MKVDISNRIRKKISDKKLIACVISSLLTGLVCYMYLFANNLQNFDNINNTPRSIYTLGNSTITMGRWSLELLGYGLGMFYKGFNVPWLNGLFAILFFGLTSYLIAEIFEIESIFTCIAISCVTVAFPSVASAMFFSFTVQYYAFACLIALLGFALYNRKKCTVTFLVGIFFLAVSIGIYQAFFPMLAGLVVIKAVILLQDDARELKDAIKESLFFILYLFCGYVLYELLQKIVVALLGAQIRNDRNAVSTVFSSLSDIFRRLLHSYIGFAKLPVRELYGITSPSMNKICFLLIYIFVFCLFIFRFVKGNKKRVIISFLTLVIFFPITTQFFEILMPNNGLYTLLMFSFLPVVYVPCLLGEKLLMNTGCQITREIINFICVMLIFMSVNWAYVTNVNCEALYYSNRKVENYYTMMFAQIRAAEGYTQDKEILFIGKNINDTILIENWELTNYVLGGNCLSREQINVYSRPAFISNYIGLKYDMATVETIEKYSEEIEQMNRYPDSGSIKVIDDKVFVRIE